MKNQIKVMKYIISLSLLFIFGCRVKNIMPETTKTIHDTIKVVEYKHDYKSVDSIVRKLLIDYYCAGWMAGSNTVIDLHNADRLTEKNVISLRQKDWRKKELIINSKKL